jgi:hypothetical protein
MIRQETLFYRIGEQNTKNPQEMVLHAKKVYPMLQWLFLSILIYPITGKVMENNVFCLIALHSQSEMVFFHSQQGMINSLRLTSPHLNNQPP